MRSPREALASRMLLMAYALPLVFLIGAPTIFITRAIFLKYYPDHFVGDSPTISETASHPPSGIFFAWFMTAVVLCIFLSWTLNAARNTWLLNGLRDAAGLKLGMKVLNLAACILGVIAGLFLFTLSIFTLNNGHDVHMASSWGFYFAQVIAITLDIAFVAMLSAQSVRPTTYPRALIGRLSIAGSILIGSLVFLYLYETKGDATPAVKYAVQLIYVGTEYILCLLCLAYPWTLFAEMRRDLHALTTEITVKPEPSSREESATSTA